MKIIATLIGILILALLVGCSNRIPPDTVQGGSTDTAFPTFRAISILAITHEFPEGNCELTPIQLDNLSQADEYCPGQNISGSFERYTIDEFYYAKMECDAVYNNTCIVTLSNNRPSKQECYDTFYKVYDGKINETCYFFACKDECEETEINRCFEIFGDLDKGCIYDYVDCVVECIDKLEDGITETYFAHEYNCLINETAEKIVRKVCY